MKEALLYEKIDKKRVRCHLCAHYCVIPEGKLGVCEVRKNIDGDLYTLVYGRTISQHVDPIEKKPLYHFYPGSTAYSIATPGCNFKCEWCQNSEIAHMPCEYIPTAGQISSPEQIVANARAARSASIAYTYTEPTIFFEYAYDTARLAKEAGIANVYVTNGYMTSEMLELFHPYLDAANVDLKAFRKRTYHRYVGAGLEPILDSLKLMKKLGIWLEVTTLVIPGINDDPDELRDAAQFVSQELGRDTPWHISRFFPHYMMREVPPTPVRTLERAREIGFEEGLRYVYLGNVSGESNTYCHQCGNLLILREGYWVPEVKILDGKCTNCGTPAAGVW
ncbi:MAG: AmmeMemoRadiSam system radical SAM enzyme [Chloroflexota bacterium]|nr:AmmeMemoRadiSam system radical SAM enzyme [Chloroflexota bacterium]